MFKWNLFFSILVLLNLNTAISLPNRGIIKPQLQSSWTRFLQSPSLKAVFGLRDEVISKPDYYVDYHNPHDIRSKRIFAYFVIAPNPHDLRIRKSTSRTISYKVNANGVSLKNIYGKFVDFIQFGSQRVEEKYLFSVDVSGPENGLKSYSLLIDMFSRPSSTPKRVSIPSFVLPDNSDLLDFRLVRSESSGGVHARFVTVSDKGTLNVRTIPVTFRQRQSDLDFELEYHAMTEDYLPPDSANMFREMLEAVRREGLAR
jgi:hypothetical protein